MQFRRIVVTPKLAAEWLKKNINNRRLRWTRVKVYADEMKAGRWVLSHQGIAFDEAGNLIDGQHRLHAVIESGVTIEFIVCYQSPSASKTVIDGGGSRTYSDIANWSGKNVERPKDSSAIALRIYYGPEGHTPAVVNSFRMELVNRYSKALHFIFKCFPSSRKRITVAPVMAVIGRAYLQPKIDSAKLVRFCEILNTGITKNENEAVVILLRNWLLEGDSRSNTTAQKLAYNKTSRALFAFFAGERITKLFEATENYFPLDTDKKDELSLL